MFLVNNKVNLSCVLLSFSVFYLVRVLKARSLRNPAQQSCAGLRREREGIGVLEARYYLRVWRASGTLDAGGRLAPRTALRLVRG